MYFLDMLVAVGPLGAILLLAVMATIPFTSAVPIEDYNCTGLAVDEVYYNVKVEAGKLCILSHVTVHGNVQSDGAYRILLMNTNVSGDVQIKNTLFTVVIQGGIIKGNVQIEDNQVRTIFDANFVVDAEIGGNLQFSKNVAGSSSSFGNLISGNTILGDLQCFDNTPAPQNWWSGPNYVYGNQDGQCSRL